VIIRSGHAQMAYPELPLEDGDLVVLTVVNDSLPELTRLLEGEV
jgi:hypothetical protein